MSWSKHIIISSTHRAHRGAGGCRVHRNHCGWTVAIWKRRKGGMSTAPVIRSSNYFQKWNSTKVINCPSFSTLFEGWWKTNSQLIWSRFSFCLHMLADNYSMKTNHVIRKNNFQTPIQVSRVTVYAGQLKFCSSYMRTCEYVMKIDQRVWIHFLRSVVIWGYHFHLAATPLGAKIPLTTWNSGA